MKKLVLCLTIVTESLTSDLVQAKDIKTKERKPNQSVNFGKSIDTKQEKVAQALAASGFSCQREHAIITELLSTDNLNLDIIQMAKDLYTGCVATVAGTIGSSKQSADTIFNNLQQSKLVCTLQIEKLERALSENALDQKLIQKLKVEFEQCRTDAKNEIAKNN